MMMVHYFVSVLLRRNDKYIEGGEGSNNEEYL